eukprot:9433767-Ditylum_brightwellii.AAC.1
MHHPSSAAPPFAPGSGFYSVPPHMGMAPPPGPMDPYMMYLLHQQQMQHVQYQKALLLMQTFQQNLTNQLTMGMSNSAVEVLQRVRKDKPTPQHVVPVWTPSNKREWVNTLKQ